VQNFIQSRGGTNDSTISFVIVGEYFKLRLDVDFGLLNNKLTFWSTDTMEFFKVCVVTLVLGLRPRQRLAKVRAMNEAQESHFMLSKM